MTRVKICGVTDLPSAESAIDAGADAVGFVFFNRSKRYIKPEKAREIIRSLPRTFVNIVGLFVNSDRDEISEIVDFCELDRIQLHGDESPESCMEFDRPVLKAFRVRDRSSLEAMKNYKVSGYLLDTYTEKEVGGTGKTFDWSIAVDAKIYAPIILAGGLNPQNIKSAIAQVEPYAVDVSSGVEASSGEKDRSKIFDFISAVREADRSRADEFLRVRDYSATHS